jgi:hypothetical protein
MNDGRHILNDEDFWLRLEYAASAWLEASADPSLSRLWVDGFIPHGTSNTHQGIDVEGAVWIGEGGRNQHHYRFVASLPQEMLKETTRHCHIESLLFDEGQQLLKIVITSGDRIAVPAASR